MSELFRPTSIITGHMNADCDALAAMVAAGKLYPDALLIAPPLLDRHTTHPFWDSIPELFGLHQPKDCDFSAVSLLIVVDTHQIPRIEHIKNVLSNPGLVIHVYDHHPDSNHDLPATYSVLKPWGSTTSILVELLEEKGVCLTPDEATILGLGLYEDTGSFTFHSTTRHDFMAAAFLHSAQMDLSVIASLLHTELTAEQIHLLDILLRNAVTHTVRGIPITITEITLEDFVGDLAEVIRKLMEMEHLKVVFALAAMGDRVHIIARSHLPEVNVQQLCTSFGGGGHSYAASASVKQPLAETRAQLLALLVSSFTSQLAVGEHMTTPAMVVHNTQTITEAVNLMNRFGLKAVPVVSIESHACIGILEQQTAIRAATHQLGHLPVTEYMQRAIHTLTPTADLNLAVELILKQHQRLVPIMENDNLIGVLTRTDIMRLLVDNTLHIPEGIPHSQEHRERNVAKLLTDQLPPQHVHILRLAGTLADELGTTVFAVGGFVRDLLLKQPNLDIDLSIEGDGPAFARALAQRLNGKVRIHPKFKTAKILYFDAENQAQCIDVATARLEYYESPAALPVVELSSIKMDLYRRDFTINALAIQLNEQRFGTLIDPFGSQRDMKEKNISVLHSLSLVEDPTRILRAIRFEQRFDFHIGAQTERLIKNALTLQMLSRLSGTRLFNELMHVFDEKKAVACILRIEEWGIWAAIHPILKLTPKKIALITSLDEVVAWYRLLYKAPVPQHWIIYMMGLCIAVKYVEVSAMLARLKFIDRARSEFLALREQTRVAAERLTTRNKANITSLSSLHAILTPVPIEGLLFLMARHKEKFNIGQDISLFLTHLRDETIDISGEDLRNLGETPGPIFGETLLHVLHEKIDGNASTRSEQLDAAHRYLLHKREGISASLNISEAMTGRR